MEHEAHRTFMNWLGCAVGAAHHESTQAALAAVQMLQPAAQATVLGRNERVDMASAALVNGSITYVSVVLDPESRTSTVRCVVDNSQRKLRLEMFATVEMPLTLQAQALVLPDSALQVMDNQPVVFVAKDSTHFEKRVVAAGERSGPWTEIKSGLQVGERVVTDGAFYVKSAFLRDEISGEE